MFLKHQILGTTAPKNHDQMKWLLPDGSAESLTVSIEEIFPNLHFSFLDEILLVLISSSLFIFSQGWVNPNPDPIHPEKFPGYSQESNPRSLRW